jgi:RNA polymerase sigma-70 factor (ECF subfamily)
MMDTFSDWAPDIARLKALDEQEWSEVERRFGGRLLAYAAKRVRDAQAREDILQETMLGAVRGIASFDALYTFEQYLFGICHNRTIDHLRRERHQGGHAASGDDTEDWLANAALESDTPSAIAHHHDRDVRARAVLGTVLKAWVQETWEQGEFLRLMVVEALTIAGWRNKDAWQRFGLRDETSAAGIKFRALKRMREIARQTDSSGELFAGEDEDDARFSFDVATVWREQRASCPARYWLGRLALSTLDEGPARFVRFHLDETGCAYCAANFADLQRIEEDPALAPMLERVHASTVLFLRSQASSTRR